MTEILLALLGILGGWLITHVYYQQQKTIRSISYSIDFFNLLTSRSQLVSDIKVTIGTRTLSRPVKIYVFIWNSGTSEISKHDIPVVAPLRLSLQNCDAVELAIQTSSRLGNAVNLTSNTGNEAKIDFEYLNPGDGFVIEGLVEAHENFQAKKEVSLLGELKGRYSKIERRTYRTKEPDDFIFSLMSIMMVTIALFSTAKLLGYESDVSNWATGIKETVLQHVGLSNISISEGVRANFDVAATFTFAVVGFFMAAIGVTVFIGTRRDAIPKLLRRTENPAIERPASAVETAD